MEVMNHMDYEVHRSMSEMIKQYREFMFNPKNQFNCSECPEQKSGNCDDELPCGQQNCWVSCHCAH